MSHLEVIARDADGNPTRVVEYTGGMEIARSYDPEIDSHVDSMLDPHEFTVVRIGREVEQLVREVNRLRKENGRLLARVKLLERQF